MGFPVIAIQLGIQIGLWAVNKYLRDETKKLPKPQPEGLEFPLAGVDTPIPYVAGTVRVQPVLVWIGNRTSTRQSNGSFLYRANMLFEIGTPMWDSASAPWNSWRAASPPRMKVLWWGDRRLAALRDTQNPTQGPTHGHKADVFYRPGGTPIVEAGFYFYDGRADQSLTLPTITRIALNMAIAGIDIANIPGYQHRMLLAVLATVGGVGGFDGRGSIGSDPRVPSVSVEVSALGPQPIGLDANPAWVLYDLLCRPVWGLGIDPSDVDFDSFQAVANTLVAESHGCSVVIQQLEDAARVFSAIQAQVDGVVYESPTTGLLKFKLIRSDYDPDELPVINADNIIGRPTIDDIHELDCPNEMRVSFTDRSRDYRKDTLPWHKEGNAAARGNQRRTANFDAPGCMNAQLASTIAGREMSIAGRPLRSISLKVKRLFYELELGDVVKVDLPQYQIDNEIYRVLEVNYGQLAKGELTMRLIRDVFDQTAGGFPGDPVPSSVLSLLPLATRVFDEAPYQLAYFAALFGTIDSLGTQRTFALAAPEDEQAFDGFRVDSVAGGPAGVYGFGEQPEVPLRPYPLTATVAVAYSRTAEPYDITLDGLVIKDISVDTDDLLYLDFVTAATAEDIRSIGRHLCLLGGVNIVPTDGGLPYQTGEIIAFEIATDLGGQLRLEGVWRGLMDTVPIDHPIGTRLFTLAPGRSVGHRDWIPGQWARGITLPQAGGVSGSEGVDATDDIFLNVVGRRFLALRPADMRITGYDVEGTPGVPSVTQAHPLFGDFKAASRLEGAVDVTARMNKIAVGTVVRGDETGWTAEAGTTFTLVAEKVGPIAEPELETTIDSEIIAPTRFNVLLGGAGHGDIDLRFDAIGADDQPAWQSPRVRVTAPTWRNLLAYDSFDPGSLTSWDELVGTASVQSGTDSLPRYAVDGYWIESATFSGGVTTIGQTVDVRGYRPGGLTAIVSWYTRNFDGDIADRSSVTIRALDAGDIELDSATSPNIVGPLTHWRREEIRLAPLPNGTAKIAVEVTLGPHEIAFHVGVTRIRLQLMQDPGEMLTNPSFDGNLTGWTNVINSFVVNTGNPYSSRNGTLGAAQGGAFSSSELRQDTSVPVGYEYGVALLTLARSLTLASDTGEVILEVRNGGGTVIATATTGAEHVGSTLPSGEFAFPRGLNTWERRRIAIQLPDGAATLRVRLRATRTLGSGNSGACFDDFSLRIHKDLDPLTTLEFDFRRPSWQPTPASWQRFHLDFPTAPTPFMAWGGALPDPVVRLSHALSGPVAAWSDASTPDPATFVGYWDVGPHPLYPDPTLRYVTSTDAYQFVRASAGAAVDLQLAGADDETGDEYGNFERDEAFALVILFRTDELDWTASAGLAGRRDNDGVGWGLQIDATGHLRAVLQGADGTATATASGTVHDRAPHWAVLVNDPDTDTLLLYDDHGGAATASTAATGSILVTGAPLRIGRDGPAGGTGGIQIARAFLFDVALSADDVATFMRYGRDPSGILTSFDAGASLWVPGPDGAAGATLIRFASDHVPIGHAGRYGLVTSPGGTNKLPSHDFEDGSAWHAETGVTPSFRLVDPTGLPLGVHVEVGAGDQALLCEEIVMGVGDPLSVVFYARTIDGVNRDMTVHLVDESAIEVDTATVTITALWQRFAVQLAGWADSSPTATLRFTLDAAGSFDLAHPIWADFGTDAVFAIQDAGVTSVATSMIRAGDMPLQLNDEGEIYVEGTCSSATPPADRSLVEIDHDGDAEDSRVLLTGAGAAAAPVFALFDSGATETDVTGDPIDWSEPFTARGRWNRLELLESLGDQIGLIVDGDVGSATYTPEAFGVGAGPLNTISIGGDASRSPPNAILHRVIVRTREPKLVGE